MSLIRQVQISLSLDTTGFSSPVRTATRQLGELASATRDTQSAVNSLDFRRLRGAPIPALPAVPAAAPSPAIPRPQPSPGSTPTSTPTATPAAAPASAAPGIAQVEAPDLSSVDRAISTVGTLRGAFTSLGPQLRTAFTTALLPLDQITARIGTEFNKLAGTVTEMARRIDAAMKFKTTDSALASLQQRISGGFAGASTSATGSLGRIQTGLQGIRSGAATAIGALRGFLAVKSFLSSIGDVAAKPLERLRAINFGSTSSSAAKLRISINGVGTAATRAVAPVRNLGREIALALGIVGVVYLATQAVVNFTRTGIRGAADLNETVSKTQEVFGNATAGVLANADQMAKAYGLPKREILDAASSIGLIAKGAGQSNAASATLANTMANLAADASSFYNVPLDTALDKIRSGLVGESEPLRAFGILLTEDAVKAEGVRLGLIKANQQLDAAGKVAARSSLIIKGLSTAQGDLARTSDSVANRSRNLKGQLTNLATAVGAALLPGVQALLGSFSTAVSAIAGFFERNKATVASFVSYFTAGVANVGTAIGSIPAVLGVFAGDFQQIFGDMPQRAFAQFTATFQAAIAQVGVILRNLPEYVAIARLRIKEQIDRIPAYFEYLKAVIGPLGVYIGDRFAYAGRLIKAETLYWVDHVRYFGDVFVAIFSNIFTIAAAGFQGFAKVSSSIFTFLLGFPGLLLEGFVAVAGKLVPVLGTAFSVVADLGNRVFGAMAKAVVGHFELLGKIFAAMIKNMIAQVGLLGVLLIKAFSGLAPAFKSAASEITAAVADATRGIKEIQERAKVAGPTGGLQLPPPPDLTSYQAQIDEITRKIKDAEEARSKPLGPDFGAIGKLAGGFIPGFGAAKDALDKGPNAVAGLTGGAAKKTSEGSDYKGTAAAEMGSKEAYSAVAKFQNKSNADQAGKATAKNTGQLVKHTKDMAQAMREIAKRSNIGDHGQLQAYTF